jgi:hypothetical protein
MPLIPILLSIPRSVVEFFLYKSILSLSISRSILPTEDHVGAPEAETLEAILLLFDANNIIVVHHKNVLALCRGKFLEIQLSIRELV